MNKANGLLLALLGITFFTRIDSLTLQTNSPLVASNIFSVPLADVGLVSIVLAVATLIFRYLVTSRIPPFSAPAYILMGLGALLISLVGSYLSATFSIFLMANAINGFGVALINPLVVSLVGLSSSREKLQGNLSLYSVTLSSALVAGPLLGGAVIGSFGLGSIFLFLAVIVGIVFLFALGARELLFGNIKKGLIISRIPENENIGEKICLLARNKLFVKTFLAMMAFGLCFALVTSYGGVYSEEYFKVKPALVQMIFLLFFVTSLLGRIIITIYTRTGNSLNSTVGFRVGLFLTVIGFGIIGLSGHIAGFLLGMVLVAVSHAILVPLSYIRTAYCVEDSCLVLGNSVIQSAFDVAGIFGPMMAVFLIPYVHLQRVFLLITVIPLLAIWYLGHKAFSFKKKEVF